MAGMEGLFPCPEGAATLAALNRMVEGGNVDRGERVVLFNTGTGLKNTDLFKVEAPVFDPDDTIDYSRI
jgi:threonine synthase